MKVVAFNGSPRKNGNTKILIDHVLAGLDSEGIETEVIQIGGELLRGCSACMGCKKNMDSKCVLKGDSINDYVAKMIEADGILIGSPTYFSDITSETKALIDRCGYVTRANGHLLKRKVGAAVVAVRRAGGIAAFDSINHFFALNQMFIPGSTYWNVGIGNEPGDVLSDEEGLETMANLGLNMAWLLQKINS